MLMDSISLERRRALFTAAATLGAVLLSGCVVVPAHRGYARYEQPPGGPDDVVASAPPPPQYEVIGIAPFPGWFWIGGHWGWSGHRHAWYGGRWEAPRPGYRWAPHRWEPMGRGWREVPGRWQR
jgi:hypothetical protein